MAWRQKGIFWKDEEVLAGTNWLDHDVNADSTRVSIDRLGITLDARSRVALIITFDGLTRAVDINNGQLIDANVLHNEEISLHPGMTYNIQHLSGTVTPTLTVSTLVSD